MVQNNTLFQIRLTAILIERDEILLVKQNVSKHRAWSLPGGRLEHGETIEQGIVRELKEETGLDIVPVKLLYLCDKPDASPPLIHVTFLVKKVAGEITLPTNEFDDNPIYDVKMVPINDLTNYDFSKKFIDIVKGDFKDDGNYMGLKQEIGL